MFWGAMTALAYFYMVSAWGGYVFITNLVPLHALTLILMGRYSSRLYVAYCTFFGLGQLLSMQVRGIYSSHEEGVFCWPELRLVLPVQWLSS
jgi:asparagine N-glycosylation enzyme membrane subunit Stt3